MHTLNLHTADRFAAIALSHVTREYPGKLDHLIMGPDDLRSPRELHPAFYGSFDWHSCVHGYWLISRLYRLYPEMEAASQVREVIDAHLHTASIASELRYLKQPGRGGFERPYGWAWLLMLAAELHRHETEEGRRWSLALRPLASEIAGRLRDFIPRATYPTRVGTHPNSAFAVALSLEYADRVGDASLGELLRERAIGWFSGDADCQAWEPAGDDFLSSALIEAECMRRVLPQAQFGEWFCRFLPRLDRGEPATLFQPAFVSDRTDGKIAHLDGLNLSRAWCWRSLATALAAGDPNIERFRVAAERHLDASMPHLAGDYMGEHWLATYALLALELR